jgi:hypothetical protein
MCFHSHMFRPSRGHPQAVLIHSVSRVNKMRVQVWIYYYIAAWCMLGGTYRTTFYINIRFVPHREQSEITDVTSQLTLHGRNNRCVLRESYRTNKETDTVWEHAVSAVNPGEHKVSMHQSNGTHFRPQHK